jgi:hypothetical protein
MTVCNGTSKYGSSSFKNEIRNNKKLAPSFSKINVKQKYLDTLTSRFIQKEC